MEKALLVSNGNHVYLELAPYNKEIEMQEIVNENPSLINISSIFDSELLVIGRESWRIDVLAITGTCVPVIIETKRKDNPDMRYLIAQVFEYASLLQIKSYREFEESASKYFSSDRCSEVKYKDKSFYDCFSSFLKDSGNDDFMEEEDFQKRIEENLKSGQFYCVMVVDSLDETTRRSINFFNQKLNKLRIEVVEIKKLSANNTNLYVPFHANPEYKKSIEKSMPGRISYEEMLINGTIKQTEFVKQIVDDWNSYGDCSYEMGTRGMSLRYKHYSILWLFIDKMYIANPLAGQLEKAGKDRNLIEKLKEIIRKNSNKNRIVFSENDVQVEKVRRALLEIYSCAKTEL